MTPNERLSVNGKIRAKEIKVEIANWPDYVFKPDYDLLSQKELEHQLKKTDIYKVSHLLQMWITTVSRWAK